MMRTADTDLTERFRVDAALALEEARRAVGRYESRLRSCGADDTGARRAHGATIVALDAVCGAQLPVGVRINGRVIRECS